MSEKSRTYGPEDENEYDEALERLVDSGRFSYDDARRILGDPPYELSKGDNYLRGSALTRVVLHGLISLEELP